jgi:L-lactate dehydrogenase complex protein LldF
MRSTAKSFKINSKRAIADPKLQDALSRLSAGFPARRRAAIERLPEFGELRADARRIKDHTLENLDFYLERFEAKVREAGGLVHWASDGAAARTIILDICRAAGATTVTTVTKGKSMIAEEIALNEHLQRHSVRVVETDLGEYILQLRGEPPSHIIAPAIHLSKAQITEVFRQKHCGLDPARRLDAPRQILDEARALLRRDFLAADVGITGANLLIAETGSVCVVTNEGNGDLTMTLPRVHIVIASIEKMAPTLEDATTILRLLARSATGQDMSVYTTFATGPKRGPDSDGPEEFHVVLLDNKRSEMLGGPYNAMLRCIRCAACLNHCPVYKAIGGHAYGWVYPGPMGAVLTPHLLGPGQADDLPEASTLCGKCAEVCPVAIPLPDLLRRRRKDRFEAGRGSWINRFAIKTWARIARMPVLYQMLAGLAVGLLKSVSGNWTRAKGFPAPEQGRTFMKQLKSGGK